MRHTLGTLGRGLLCLCAALAAPGLAAPRQSAPPPLHSPTQSVAVDDTLTNVLMIVGDDIGVDKIACYGAHPNPPPTPNIDALAERGILFRNAYADPWCSPTRATIMTGRFGFRVGLGAPIRPDFPEFALQFSEVTLPELLHAGAHGSIATSAIGKWHLGSLSYGGDLNPNLQGWDDFRGTVGNLVNVPTGYYHYQKTVNGTTTLSTIYATIEQTDDALARMAAMPEPWLCYLAFNAAHRPIHAPPSNLHTYQLSGVPLDTPIPHFNATVQAMDTEIGRLFASIDPQLLARTTVIFIGDNGTEPLGVEAPADNERSKGTVYEGGVHVPLIIAGKHVEQPGSECNAFVNSVDLFPTVADLLGVDVASTMPDSRPIDGVSVMPLLGDSSKPSLRPWVYADAFTNGFGPYDRIARMIRDDRWKLIEVTAKPDQFYDMLGAEVEGADLLLGELTPQQQSAYSSLKKSMRQLVGD
jgi:arylsulfatase A-like enzyme